MTTAKRRQAALRDCHRCLIPDGTIDAQDRAWLLWSWYPGILAVILPTAGQWAVRVVIKPFWETAVAIRSYWQAKVK